MIAAAARIGVGVLTASALLGPTDARRGRAGPRSPTRAQTGAVPGGQAGQSRLHGQGHERRACPPRRLQGQSHPVNFWATWCAPCKVEIPGFIELYDQYKDKGFVILGVSATTTPRRCGRSRPNGRSTIRCSSAGRREAARRLRAALRLSDSVFVGPDGRLRQARRARRRRRSSRRRSRRSCSMIP